MVYDKHYQIPKRVIEIALSPQLLLKDCNNAPKSDLFLSSYWKLPPNGSFKLNIDGVIFFNI